MVQKEEKIKHVEAKLKEFETTYEDLPMKQGIIAQMMLNSVNYCKNKLKKLQKNAQED